MRRVSAWALITGPQAVVASAGSAAASWASALASASASGSYASPTAITRLVAVHFWPA
ncbi:hypothetical protein [Kitasatospora griseola]|uniref:hypothetical protein n=1 Tax=Kitasatospora griseola TaxID=2064 RepID=UPI0027E554FE|nr:hypothetical protein [Kitasatospora griseola]